MYAVKSLTTMTDDERAAMLTRCGVGELPNVPAGVVAKLIEGTGGGYAVDSAGSVWTRKRHARGGIGVLWRRMRPATDRGGYLTVTIRSNGRRRTARVATLVLVAFVGPRPEGMQACHFPDRDPANNHINNLRWDTPKANQADRVAHGTDLRGEKHVRSKLTEADVVEIRRARREEKTTWSRLARRFRVDRRTVRKAASAASWSHVGGALAT